MMRIFTLHLDFTAELDGSLPDFKCEFLQPSQKMAEEYARKILTLMAQHIPVIAGGVLFNETEENAVEYRVNRPPSVELLEIDRYSHGKRYERGCAPRARDE